MHYGATRSITVHVSASWCKEELNKAIKSNLVALGAIQNFMRKKANSSRMASLNLTPGPSKVLINLPVKDTTRI